MASLPRFVPRASELVPVPHSGPGAVDEQFTTGNRWRPRLAIHNTGPFTTQAQGSNSDPGNTTWRWTMRRTLRLSKETLRILDDDELALVAGGAGSDHNNGH